MPGKEVEGTGKAGAAPPPPPEASTEQDAPPMAPVCGGQPRGRRDAGAVWLGGHVKRGARDREAAISAHDPITRWTLSCSLKRRKSVRGHESPAGPAPSGRAA